MKSYQKIHALGKKEVFGILDDHINVEEKVDGSQFRIEINSGMVSCASHHLELSMTDSNFKLGTDQAGKVFSGIESNEAISIFAEYLSKPKMNQIPYERVPRNNFIIFDVMIGEKVLDREEKERFAFQYNCEVVPLLWRGDGKELTPEVIEKLLTTKSVLGHQGGYDRIEGIVIKNYNRKFIVAPEHSLYGHFMTCKVVNDSFKETKKIKSPRGSEIEGLKESMRSIPRWEKAVQNLREKNELKNDITDIGLVIRRVMTDIKEEESETIKQELYDIFIKEILQHSTSGLATWYQTEKLK